MDLKLRQDAGAQRSESVDASPYQPFHTLMNVNYLEADLHCENSLPPV